MMMLIYLLLAELHATLVYMSTGSHLWHSTQQVHQLQELSHHVVHMCRRVWLHGNRGFNALSRVNSV